MVICLQETHLKHRNSASFKNFDLYRCDFTSDNDRARGGVMTLVRSQFVSRRFNVDTVLQVVVVELLYPFKFTLCNIYLPPNEPIEYDELAKLIIQLPKPFIILGDFNAHHSLWGSKVNSTRGKLIENLLSNFDLNIFNDGKGTRLNSSNGNETCIDLTICSASLSTLFSWNVLDDTCNSDHYPIFITPLNTRTVDEKRPHWILKTADWEKFSLIANFDDAFFNKSIDDQNAHVVETIINAANHCIKKSSAKAGRKSVPWWNDTISKAVKDRTHSLNYFKKHPTSENEKRYKILKSKARALMRYHSKQSWRNMVASINSNVPQTLIWKQIRSISGRHQSNLITALKHNDSILSSRTDIVKLLGKHCSEIS